MIPRVEPEGMLFRKVVATFRDHALPRLRPDIEQRGLAGLHRRDRFLERRTERGGILDRPPRPPAHGLRELVIFDVRVLDAGPDRAHVVAEARDAIAEVG